MSKPPQAKPPPQPDPPEQIPLPPPVSRDSNDPGYIEATQDIKTREHLDQVTNFIGEIYGQARQLDETAIGNSEFVKGLKFDPKKEILDLRNHVIQNNSTNAPQQPPPVLPALPAQQTPTPGPNQQIPTGNMTQPAMTAPGDSLILKAEIDNLKEQVKEIKKLYDEFFKLKQVKGKWTITCDGKDQTAPSIAKAWNSINKLLKNKTPCITIRYTEDG